jgi:hypothetical protein
VDNRVAHVRIWIPGAPASPNSKPGSTRARMALVKSERERARVMTIKVRNGLRIEPITRPVEIRFEVRRRRLLDPMVNLPGSLKAYQDGVCAGVLPLGDGPYTPYTWLPPRQVQVKQKADEGVLVSIWDPEAARDETAGWERDEKRKTSLT